MPAVDTFNLYVIHQLSFITLYCWPKRKVNVLRLKSIKQLLELCIQATAAQPYNTLSAKTESEPKVSIRLSAESRPKL